jgi:hypothetical protein
MPEFTDSPALGPPQGDAFRTGFLDRPGCKLPRDRSAPHQGDQRFESLYPSKRGVQYEPDFPLFILAAEGRLSGRENVATRSGCFWPSTSAYWQPDNAACSGLTPAPDRRRRSRYRFCRSPGGGVIRLVRPASVAARMRNT